MKREIIHSDKAPRAIGPYSQGLRIGDTIYLSGQIPLVPETMELLQGDIKAQIQQVFESLSQVAIAAGGSLAQIVKLTILLIDMNDFSEVNEVMQQLFLPPYPARATFAVKELPKKLG